MTGSRPAPSRIRVRPGGGPPPSVDGHPGWVLAEQNAWGWLGALLLCALSLLTGSGTVLTRALCAAWWLGTLGTLAGALLVWLPVWGLSRARKGAALCYDEALCAAFGRPLGALFSLLAVALALLDAAFLLRALSGVVRHYLIAEASDVSVMLFGALALAVMLCRHRGQGFARCAWGLRFVLLVFIVAACLLMAQNASAHNLYPLLGGSVSETLGALPISLSGGASLALLGLVPRLTGSAKPPRFSLGLRALCLGALLSGALVLFINLSLPPRALDAASSGGIRLMMAIEYLRRAQFYRVCYLFALALLLVLGAGAALCAGGALLSGLWRQKKPAPAWLACCLIVAAVSFCPDGAFNAAAESLRCFGALAVAAPAWLGWLLLTRRRGGKEA